jgi:hypothetical protein
MMHPLFHQLCPGSLRHLSKTGSFLRGKPQVCDCKQFHLPLHVQDGGRCLGRFRILFLIRVRGILFLLQVIVKICQAVIDIAGDGFLVLPLLRPEEAEISVLNFKIQISLISGKMTK